MAIQRLYSRRRAEGFLQAEGIHRFHPTGNLSRLVPMHTEIAPRSPLKLKRLKAAAV